MYEDLLGGNDSQLPGLPVRDPQRTSDPARLLRIATDGSTEVVYESPGAGRAFLSAPRCGGTDLTVTAFTEEGDEQVTARVG